MPKKARMTEFERLVPGCRVLRCFVGVSSAEARPVDCTVVQVDADLIYVAPKGMEGLPVEALWAFDRKTGWEEDASMGWGVVYGKTGSRLSLGHPSAAPSPVVRWWDDIVPSPVPLPVFPDSEVHAVFPGVDGPFDIHWGFLLVATHRGPEPVQGPPTFIHRADLGLWIRSGLPRPVVRNLEREVIRQRRLQQLREGQSATQAPIPPRGSIGVVHEPRPGFVYDPIANAYLHQDLTPDEVEVVRGQAIAWRALND